MQCLGADVYSTVCHKTDSLSQQKSAYGCHSNGFICGWVDVLQRQIRTMLHYRRQMPFIQHWEERFSQHGKHFTVFLFNIDFVIKLAFLGCTMRRRRAHRLKQSMAAATAEH
jgi:hypothetical protein